MGCFRMRQAMPLADSTVIVIEARPKTLTARLVALWQYRAFYPFLFREISMKKFRGTALGFWWLILRPPHPDRDHHRAYSPTWCAWKAMGCPMRSSSSPGS